MQALQGRQAEREERQAEREPQPGPAASPLVGELTRALKLELARIWSDPSLEFAFSVVEDTPLSFLISIVPVLDVSGPCGELLAIANRVSPDLATRLTGWERELRASYAESVVNDMLKPVKACVEKTHDTLRCLPSELRYGIAFSETGAEFTVSFRLGGR